MGDDVTPVTAAASEPAPLPSAPRSSNPALTFVPVTPSMRESVDRYLSGKGLAYLDELRALVESVEADAR